jgi:hypothetical protein
MPVEHRGMNRCDWHARFEGDSRVLALSTAIRDGRCWLYVECTSARAATLLMKDLQLWGHVTVARRNPVSLWLEEEA